MTAPSIAPLITAEKIAVRMTEMAKTIAASIPDELIVVSLLRGSFVFTADLMRALHLAGVKNLHMDFITLASYGKETTTSGNVRIVHDLTDDVAGRHVLIVDDILESGLTLAFAKTLLEDRKVKSVKIAVLLEKPGKRKAPVSADFVGFTIPDTFVVGYGMDYANLYRELPFVGVLSQ